jgi:large conductance mechanosensitive channel
LIKEFREFINRGNIMDLAVAVVIGAAFGLVVTSFVNDILMQVVAAFFGQPNFDALSLHWGSQIGTDPDTGLALYEGQIYYGRFLTVLVNFLIIAFAVFLVVKAYNTVQREEEDEEEDQAGPTEVELLTEIRDSLRRT